MKNYRKRKKYLTTFFLSGFDNNNAFWTEIAEGKSSKSFFQRFSEQGAPQQVCKFL